MKVLAFGEILWDVYPTEKFLGGASLNFGAHLAKHGHEVYMLSALGKDGYGEEALEQVRKWGLQDDFVAVLSDQSTGTCVVTLDDNGMPSYDLKNHVAYDHIPGEAAGDFDVLYFGTLALRGEHNRASVKKLLAEKEFKQVFVDVNIRPPYQMPETAAMAAENATILKISEEELAEVARLLGMEQAKHDIFAKALAAKYPNLRYIIITLGGDGAYALDCGSGAEVTCPSEKVTVASTVGAGDSYCSAFIHHYMQGDPLDVCVHAATRLSSHVVAHREAIPPM